MNKLIELQRLTNGKLYPSEAEYPFEVFTVRQFIENAQFLTFLANTDIRSKIEKTHFDTFLEKDGEFLDLYVELSMDITTTYKITEDDVNFVYLVLFDCGKDGVIIIKTKSVET